MEIKRSFTKGVMNKSLDDRLLPDGFYRDASNIKVSSTEGDDAGTVQNYLGNIEKLDIDDVLLADAGLSATNITPIGSYTDTQNNNIYWFLTSDQCDMIARYHEDDSGTATGSMVLIDEISIGYMNFNSEYLINGVNLVEDLLFFTDGLNQPRRIDVNVKYRNLVGGSANNINDDTVNVIVKPPLASPVVETVLETGDPSKSLEDKFIRFAYRYKYKNNEVSSLSPFSKTAFEAQNFSLDFTTGENNGMKNNATKVEITVDLGSSEVEKIEIVSKDSRSTNASIVTSINRADHISSGQIYTYNFRNDKVYSVLPDSQVNRLFDNVPLRAKSQDIIGRRIVYGNYRQFFDLRDFDNNKIVPKFSLVHKPIDIASGSPKETFKAGRSYEAGIAYLDQFGRMTTVLESESEDLGGDTQTIPMSYADKQNKLRVFIANKPPQFATNYRIFLKQNKGTYYNIIPTAFVTDGMFVYFKMARYDVDKVKEGDYIYVKSSLTGVAKDNDKYKVLEAENKEKDFLGAQNEQVQDPGYYIKVKILDTSYFTGDNLYVVKDTVRSVNSKKKDRLKGSRDPLTGLDLAHIDKVIHYGSGDNKSLSVVKSGIQIKGTGNRGYTFDTDRRFILTITGSRTFSLRDYNLTQNYLTDVTMNSDDLPNLFGDGPSATQNGNEIQINLGGKTYTFAHIKWNENDYTVGDKFVLNYRGFSRGIFGTPVKFSVDRNKYHSGPYVAFPNRGSTIQVTEGDLSITVGSVIEIRIKEDGTGWQKNQKFTSQGNYDNIEEWFFEDRVYQKFNAITDYGKNGGSVSVFFRRGFLQNETIDGRQVCWQNDTGNEKGYVSMFIKGYEGSDSTERKEMVVEFKASIPTNIAVLETEGKPLSDDIYYETPKTYPILNPGTTNAVHGVLSGDGDVAQQKIDNTTYTEAHVTIEDFNAITFGNGLESSIIQDDWNGPEMGASPRVSSSIDRYEQIDAVNSLTYSGIFNESSKTNNLNEFNLSLANFKALEQDYGSIQKLYSRDRDLIVFQEDKVSKVLFEKNILSDAVGGGTVASVPQVLGQQVPYLAEYGISKNPESFAKWGGDIFFTDQKRGAVLNLTQSGIKEISSYGMRSWFRDLFDNYPTTQKMGAFDPHEYKYVLVSNDSNNVGCDLDVFPTEITVDQIEQFGAALFSIKSNSSWSITEVADWLSINPSSGTGNNQITGDISENTTGSERSTTITIEYCDGLEKYVTVRQSISTPKELRVITKGDKTNDGDKGVDPRYDYGSGDIGVGVDTIGSDGDYSLSGTKKGYLGQNSIPGSGSSVDIKASTSDGTSTNPKKPFNPNLGNKMYYLDTDTLYDTKDGDSLISASSEVSAYTLNGSDYEGNFTYSGTNDYLYLVVDYTNILDHGDSVSSIPVPTSGLPDVININNSSSIGLYSITYSSTSSNIRFTVENSGGSILADSDYEDAPSGQTFSIKKTTTGKHVIKVYNTDSGTYDISIGSISLTSASIGTSSYDEAGYSGYTADEYACSDTSGVQTVYHNGSSVAISAGDTVYTSSDGSTVLDGSDDYYKHGTSSIRISSGGVVTEKRACSCSETSSPSITQQDIVINKDESLKIGIQATNNPISFSAGGNCRTYEFFGGVDGAVFNGTDCDSGTSKSFFLSGGEKETFCYFSGTVAKVAGSGAATFTDIGGCIESSLPEGLTFNSTDGVISGTPSETGVFTFTVNATNCFGTSSDASFKITVNEAKTKTPRFKMDVSNSQTTTSAVCAITTPTYSSYYHDGILGFPVIYDVIYSDPEGYNVYDGNNKWYLMENGSAIKIDGEGIVVDTFLCDVNDPSVPTYKTISLAFSSTSASDACDSETFVTYYYSGTFASSGSVLYTDTEASSKATTGYYKYDTGNGTYETVSWDSALETWGTPSSC